MKLEVRFTYTSINQLIQQCIFNNTKFEILMLQLFCGVEIITMMKMC
jgi:hypothetical protein